MVLSLSRKAVGGAKCSSASRPRVSIAATEKNFVREKNIKTEITLSQGEVGRKACLQRVPSVQPN